MSIIDVDVSIDVLIIDVDVSIIDVHVSIIDVDASIYDSYVSISSIDVDIGLRYTFAIAITSFYVSNFVGGLGAGATNRVPRTMHARARDWGVWRVGCVMSCVHILSPDLRKWKHRRQPTSTSIEEIET